MKTVQILSFFGPPGSGKGTVAERCVRDLGFTMLSTGNVCRKHIQERTELGEELKSYIDAGQLVPDELITKMVLKWLEEIIKSKDKVILDGFPRTKRQAELFTDALQSDPMLADIEFSVVHFDVSDKEILKRIESRLVCDNKRCQAVYSATVDEVTEGDACKMCGTPLIRRSDDNLEVARERLGVFAKFKQDLLGYYQDFGHRVLVFVPTGGLPDDDFREFQKLLI